MRGVASGSGGIFWGGGGPQRVFFPLKWELQCVAKQRGEKKIEKFTFFAGNYVRSSFCWREKAQFSNFPMCALSIRATNEALSLPPPPSFLGLDL